MASTCTDALRNCTGVILNIALNNQRIFGYVDIGICLSWLKSVEP
ncbi:MAG TPA: hypothetical protein V6D14_20435 [Coleofasciculaceae cyanobacterium]